MPFVPLSFNERFGQMMNLEHAPEYLELGQSVIALLSEQEPSRALPTIDRLLSPRDPGASVELNRDPPADLRQRGAGAQPLRLIVSGGVDASPTA